MDLVHVQEPKKESAALAATSPTEDDSGSDVSASPSEIENSPPTLQQSTAGPDQGSASISETKPHLQVESLSAVKQRLLELDAVEDILVTRRNKLVAKRERKDARIHRRLQEEDASIEWQRAEEDAKVKRQREEEDARRAQNRMAREDRIRERREREDADYREREKAHEDEEYELRRRLKNLKRVRPADEEVIENRRASTVSESMSPPAKKHQQNPASVQTVDSPRPSSLQPLQPRPQEQQPATQYPYYYGWNPPPVTGPYAYGPGETYQPQNQPLPAQQNRLSSAPLPNGGPPRFNPPAHPPTHGPFSKATPPPSQAQSPHHQAQAHAPLQGSSQYDVRPPSATSDFPSINTPTSGFPSINQPPTHVMRTPILPAPKAKRSHPPSAKVHAISIESAVQDSPKHAPAPTPRFSTPTLGGKRKASTTHPYSQSEAFANRHHHCERTDELDRGIWMYFGPGGTKEAPTVAGKKEMYLRCSHDDCMRIDWKTVHGLQCHIVKNHGIPKGTIGSLELALEKYGVEVQEVEEHEKKHGLGSAGAMVEKASRVKARTKASNEIAIPRSSGLLDKSTAGPAVAPSKLAPAARPKPSAPIVLFPNLAARSPSGGYVQDDIVYSEDESDGDTSSAEFQKLRTRKLAGAAHWKASDSEVSTPPVSRAGGDDDLQSIPRAVLIQERTSRTIDDLKSPEPRPTSSTETLAVAASAPPSTESLPPPSTDLPLHSVTQTPPMGTETQKSILAAQRVNARLDAEDPDFVATATPAESDIPSLTQPQAQSQTPNLTTQVSDTQDTTMSSTKHSTSRPRGGAERRVPASKRWDWAPVEDDDTTSTSTTTKKIDGNGTTLTKAQQELQGIDGSVGEGDGEDGRGGEEGNATAAAKSPTTSRYSARKKTRRRVDV